VFDYLQRGYQVSDGARPALWILSCKLTFLLNIGHNLHATASSTYDSHTFPIQRVALFIGSGVHELALVVLDTRNIRPLEVVQDTSRIDEELGLIIDDSSSSKIADPQLPHAFRCIPLRVFDLVLELDILVDEVVFFVDAFEVLENLW
jgi:hypothetical protein